jgi:hypothetical protein
MAPSLIFITSILAAEFTGRIQMLWFLFGLLGLISIFSSKTTQLPTLFGICALGMTSWIARDIFTLGISIAMLLLVRCLDSEEKSHSSGTKEKLIFWVLMGIFGLHWHSALLQTISLAGIATAIPTFRITIPSLFVKISLCLGTSIALLFIFKGLEHRNGGKVAYVEHGRWANAEALWDIDHISLRSAYAYSEIAKMLSADRVKLLNLNKSYNEAWMVTPTNPLSDAELSSLHSWIRRGGALILVTDHTDVFGHGRVANQILKPLGIQTDYTAFFPVLANDKAKDGWFGNYQMRTTTTFKGYGIFPLVTARWFNEAGDYSTKNFFGRLRATGEDEHARRVLVGVRDYGRGRVVLMADSTMFSNFATYAPDSLRLAAVLRTSFSWVSLYLIFPGLLVLFALGHHSTNPRKLNVLSGGTLCLVMLLTGWQEKPCELSWGNDNKFLWWSGDSDLVQGENAEDQNLSTAYIISTLADRKPRWTDVPKDVSPGIWVSREPPPNAAWRWITPNTVAGELEVDEPAFSPLYEVLDASPLLEWPSHSTLEKLHAGNLWTNNILGDEWFDRGVSPARLGRFKALRDWIEGKTLRSRNVSIPIATTISTWSLKLPDRERVLLDLPLSPGEEEEFVYLGRGLSAKWTRVEDRMCLVGLKPFMETSNAPEIWVLQPVTK